MQIAMFVRLRVNGSPRDWRFEGMTDSEVKAYEVKLKVEEENGNGSFFMTYLPEDVIGEMG